MPLVNPLNTKPLREQVYDHLREALGRGELRPGSTLDLNELSARLGTSRTPVREALLQLEMDGFVEIRPRRGCVVRALTREDIREIYQIIGALESSVITLESDRITPAMVAGMRQENERMRAALARDDFDGYYEANLRFHDAYLALSPNRQLRRITSTLKQRLYDFPRRRSYVKEWEEASTVEHERLVMLLEAGDIRAAAEHVREVHWSYEVQRPFIERYYAAELREES